MLGSESTRNRCAALQSLPGNIDYGGPNAQSNDDQDRYSNDYLGQRQGNNDAVAAGAAAGHYVEDGEGPPDDLKTCRFRHGSGIAWGDETGDARRGSGLE